MQTDELNCPECNERPTTLLVAVIGEYPVVDVRMAGDVPYVNVFPYVTPSSEIDESVDERRLRCPNKHVYEFPEGAEYDWL